MTEIKKVVDNWRNISKSDYIASIDVESIIKNNGKCVLTIKTGTQHLAKDDQHLPARQQFRVNGNRGDFNIIHFIQDVKPMVVNVGNSQVLWRFVDTGNALDESVSKWAGLSIELIVDKTVEYQGNKGSIVILNQLPTMTKPVLCPEASDWDGWKAKVQDRVNEEYAECADLKVAKETVRTNLTKHFMISDNDWTVLCG